MDLLAVQRTLKSLLRARLRMIPETKIIYIEKIKRFIISPGAKQHLTESGFFPVMLGISEWSSVT